MSLRPPPPLFVAGMTLKVGEMVGFGPSPGWQYTNAVKVGRKRVDFHTTPPSFYEYDEMEYIHPQWEAALDYSKKKMPSRVWFNGMLYSPGIWLTSNQKGQKPNEVEVGLGSPRFRAGMNYPEQEDPLSRVVNQSHPFRIWKPYSKNPLSPAEMRGPNSGVFASKIPDGPMLHAIPINTADERTHYTGDFTSTAKWHYPSPSSPWRNEVKTENGTQTFKIKGYNYEKPEETPIAVSSQTGKMTTFNIVCVNAESDFTSWYWSFYGVDLGQGWGISLSNLFTESTIDTMISEWENIVDGNGDRRLKTKWERSIGGAPPADRKYYISESKYDLKWNPSGDGGFYGIFDVSSMNLVGSWAKQSCWNGDLYNDNVRTDEEKHTGSNGNYNDTSKYGMKLPLNVYLFSGSTPFIYTRVAKAQSFDVKSTSKIVFTSYTNCTTITNITRDGHNKGIDINVTPKRWGISVGGSSPDVAPKPGFQQNIFYCDKYSMASAEYYEMSDRTYTSRYSGGSPCGASHSTSVDIQERKYYPTQWGWVQ